ncbi:protein timeless [Lepeophtheirus salmonis]|uniref:protein timeless n=1 Tax=Lepeophtheirus salmonis TaxID=72036 RepID=UPI003AF3AB2C
MVQLEDYRHSLKVLSELTKPIEDYVDVFINSNESNHYRHELIHFWMKLKIGSRTVFTKQNNTPCSLHSKEVANILSIPEPSNAISAQSVSSISHSTTTVSSSRSQRQNQIIWNFFAADLDKFILLAIEEDTLSNQWSTLILEVITLIFMDQSRNQLESILREMMENPDLDDSTDDNESNLSSSQQDISMNEDSSDSNTEENNGNANNLMEYNDDAMARQSSSSDSNEPPSKRLCGHNKSSNSMNKTSSTELEETVKEMVNNWITTLPGDTKMDPEVSTESSSNDNDQSVSIRIPIGPHVSASEKREIRRNKILKIVYNSMKKRREQSTVDDDDVSRLLTEFTICFIMRGYGNLIENLRLKLMTEKPSSTFANMNSRFLWLITFFMRFVDSLEVELPVIEPVFSPEIMSYIVFQGLQTFENLEIDSYSHMHNDIVVKTQGRRLHLVVSAIKQILITINLMEHNAYNTEIRFKIHRIILLLMEMNNLRQFHLLLIWKFNSSYQTRYFLSDVILCNHKLLVMFEKVESSDKFINEHLDQFATVEVMRQYGYCLETFESNTVSLNEAIFKIMNYVSVDLNAPEALFIPQILNIFSDVLERDLFVGDNWSDLIEYVSARCMNTIPEDPINEPPRFLRNISLYIEIAEVKPTLAKNYTSSDATRCFIAELDSKRGESESGHDNSKIWDSSTPSSEKVYVEEIKGLKDLLLIQGKGYLIHWLQEEIINVILVKAHEKSKSSVKWKRGVLEPIPYYSLFCNESIPMVPWNINLELGLQKNYFLMLLKKIGIYLPRDRSTRFPRIPKDWSIDHLLTIHKKLDSSEDVTSEEKLAHANKQIAKFAK